MTEDSELRLKFLLSKYQSQHRKNLEYIENLKIDEHIMKIVLNLESDEGRLAFIKMMLPKEHFLVESTLDVLASELPPEQRTEYYYKKEVYKVKLFGDATAKLTRRIANYFVENQILDS